MLPSFDEHGNLPPGIHRCTIEELIQHFGTGSVEREVEIQELLEFIAWAREADIQRVIVNGSFVTSKESPNDVDVVILPGPNYPRSQNPAFEEITRFPFLQIVVAADEDDLIMWVSQDFGTDRRPKGVVEVLL